MKHLLSCFLCLAALLGALSACRMEYRQDLAPAEIADYIERELSSGSVFRSLDDKASFYGDAFPLERVDTFALRVAEDGSNLDEFGIFSCSDEEAAKALAKDLENYLTALDQANREWYLSYIPEQIPKLQDAEVKIYGRYVAYAILSENERNLLFDLIKQKLLQAKKA